MQRSCEVHAAVIDMQVLRRVASVMRDHADLLLAAGLVARASVLQGNAGAVMLGGPIEGSTAHGGAQCALQLCVAVAEALDAEAQMDAAQEVLDSMRAKIADDMAEKFAATPADTAIAAAVLCPNTALGADAAWDVAMRALQDFKAAVPQQCPAVPGDGASDESSSKGDEPSIESEATVAASTCMAWLVAAAEAGHAAAQTALARCLSGLPDKRTVKCAIAAEGAAVAATPTAVGTHTDNDLDPAGIVLLQACVQRLYSHKLQPMHACTGLYWCTRASQAHHTPAMTLLGDMLSRGVGCGVDVSGAREWLQRAVDAGDALACTVLGEVELKHGGDDKRDTARGHFEAAAERGDAQGMMRLGVLLRDTSQAREDREAAFGHMKAAAELGNVRARVELARMYQYGDGCTVDHDAMRKWQAHAAATGDVDAVRRLGKDLRKNRDKEVAAQGFSYCKWAAERGDPWAELNLGECYRHGWGCKPNKKYAQVWLKRAAHSNLSLAWKLLGDLVAESDPREALRLYVEAAKLEVDGGGGCRQQGMLKLAEMYATGFDCLPKDSSKSLMWRTRAAELGNVRAALEVSKHHTKAGNDEEAFYWCKAAYQYDLLGEMYEQGKGCAVDTDAARECYEKVIEQAIANRTVTGPPARRAQRGLGRLRALTEQSQSKADASSSWR